MKTYSISEIFGPTIQGEGPQIGQIVNFVRFAGCDYDCEWCDTKYAIRPSYEGWKKKDFTAQQIVDQLDRLVPKAKWVVLSGGNPALFVDTDLLSTLEENDYDCAMETQGTHLAGDWFKHSNLRILTLSPKPPSAKQPSTVPPEELGIIWKLRAEVGLATVIKYVVFDQVDLDWVIEYDGKLRQELNGHHEVERCISVGTRRVEPYSLESQRSDILNRYAWLVDAAKGRRQFRDFRILPQLHVLLWGQQRGV